MRVWMLKGFLFLSTIVLDLDKLPNCRSMITSVQTLAVFSNAEHHKCVPIMRQQHLIASFGVLSRGKEFPRLQFPRRCDDMITPIVTKISPCLLIFEPKKFVLLHTVPVRVFVPLVSDIVDRDVTVGIGVDNFSRCLVLDHIGVSMPGNRVVLPIPRIAGLGRRSEDCPENTVVVSSTILSQVFAIISACRIWMIE